MKKKILVVDNQPVMLKFMSGLLGREGCEVLTAGDGLTALEILKTEVPDVIFIDLIMPHISGEKLCRIIRKMPRLKDAYLVIISAIAVEQTASFVEFGADACIAKGPLNKMEQYVLSILEKLERQEAKTLSERILGFEELCSREITKELLWLRHHFEVTLGTMSEGILEVATGGNILYSNAASLSLFGVPEEALLASHISGHFHPGDRKRINELLGRASSTDNPVEENAPFRIGDRLVKLKMIPVRDDTYTITIILNDITEWERMQERLRQAHKMEAIGTLAGGIAHDFNNLLTVILGNISLVKTALEPGSKFFERLTAAERASLKAEDLTNRLLTFARGGKFAKRVTSIGQLIRDSATLAISGSSVKPEFHISENLWTVEADVGQMRQVIHNLVINAAESMPGGGVVTIAAENSAVSAASGLPIREGNYVKVSITDRGKGICEESLLRIFDPYFTTKEMGSRKGTGLGLAICYSIIRVHEGHIDTRSTEGVGTTIAFYIPASEKKEISNRTEEINPITGSGRILLVDDDEVVRNTATEMLGHMGYDTVYVADGKEAVDLYQKSKDAGEGFDTVIMDLTIPGGMGGKEAISRLLEIDPMVKAIVSSGYSNDPIMTDFRKYGFQDVIRKPYRIREMSEVIHRVLTGK
jgi:two-component system, cell cycle sensor histidine kinase and response regulator CckA